MTSLKLHRPFIAAAFLALLAAAVPARADTLTIGGGIKYEGIEITGVHDGQIFFKSPSNGDTSKRIEDNMVLSVDGEEAFSDAEALYGAKRYADATDKYMTAMDATSKAWIRDWAASRLQVTAEKSQRFDAAVIGWIFLAQKDPDAADKSTPALPAATSPYLTASISKVKSAVAAARSDAQKATLLNFLMKMQTQAGDNAAQDTARELLALQQKTAVAGATADDGGNRQAGITLSMALLALEKKDFKGALESIEENRRLYSVTQQPEALWVIAEAKAGLAGATNNTVSLQDLALNYMQLVANFPSSNRAATALFKTAALLERMDDKPTALSTYQQVIRDYPDQPAAIEAKSAVSRLQAAGVKPNPDGAAVH